MYTVTVVNEITNKEKSNSQYDTLTEARAAAWVLSSAISAEDMSVTSVEIKAEKFYEMVMLIGNDDKTKNTNILS